MNYYLKENSKVTGHEKQHRVQLNGSGGKNGHSKGKHQKKKKKKRISSSQLRKVKALKVKVADSYETYK